MGRKSKKKSATTKTSTGPDETTAISVERKRKPTTVLNGPSVPQIKKKDSQTSKELSDRENCVSDLTLSSILTFISDNDPIGIASILRRSPQDNSKSGLDLNEVIPVAVKAANLEIVKQLVFHVGKLDLAIWSQCIRSTIEYGLIDILQFLIAHNKNKTDVEKALKMSDKNGNTFLHLCQDNQKVASHLTRLILTYTKEMDEVECINIQNKLGETPLMKAVQNKNLEAIAQLNAAGADKTIKDKQGNTVVTIAQKHGIKCIFQKDANILIALKNAVLARDAQELQFFLLSISDNINCPVNKSGDTLLNVLFNSNAHGHGKSCKSLPVLQKDKLCTSNCKEHKVLFHPFTDKDKEIASILIRAGANFFHRGRRCYWCMPFLMAIEIEDNDLVDIMLMNQRHDLTDDAVYPAAIAIAMKNNYLNNSNSELFDKLVPLLKDLKGGRYQQIFSEVLEFAVKLGRDQYLPTLLEFAKEYDIFQLMLVALKNGNVSTLAMLQKEKKRMKKQIKSIHATHLLSESVEANNVQLIEMLLDLGVKPMYKDVNVHQPLVFSKSTKVTKLLLQHGADINHKYEHVHKSGTLSDYTPIAIISALTESVRTNSMDIFKLLIENGAQIDNEFAFFLLDKGLDHIDKKFEKYIFSTIDKVKLDCSGMNTESQQRIHYFFHSAVRGGNISVLKYFFKKGFYLHTCIFSALVGAVIVEDKTLITYLLKLGFDINFRSQEDETLVLKALEYGNLEMIPFLAQKGADLNDKNEYGDTYLMLAATKRIKNNQHHTKQKTTKESKCSALLKAGANANAEDCNGNTLLTRLLCGKWMEMDSDLIKLLVEHGGQVSSNESHYAIHRCILEQQFDLMSSLIHDGGLVPTVIADVDSGVRFCPPISKFFATGFATFKKVLTPFMIAMLAGFAKLTQAFLDHHYLTVSDLKALGNLNISAVETDFPELKDSLRTVEFLTTSPPSLMMLSFAHVSDMLGAEGSRRQKVKQLGIPKRLQEALAFIPGTQSRIETDEYNSMGEFLLSSDDENDDETGNCVVS